MGPELGLGMNPELELVMKPELGLVMKKDTNLWTEFDPRTQNGQGEESKLELVMRAELELGMNAKLELVMGAELGLVMEKRHQLINRVRPPTGARTAEHSKQTESQRQKMEFPTRHPHFKKRANSRYRPQRKKTSEDKKSTRCNMPIHCDNLERARNPSCFISLRPASKSELTTTDRRGQSAAPAESYCAKAPTQRQRHPLRAPQETAEES